MKHRLIRIGFALVVAAGLAVASVPAKAQDNGLQPLLDRLERLERDIRVLNVQLARGDGAAPAGASGDGVVSGPAMARQAVRLTTIEEDMRSLTGASETLSHNLSRLMERLDKLVGDVDYRLTALENAAGLGGTAAAAANTAAPGAGTVTSVQSQSLLGSQPGVLGRISEKDLAAVRPAGDGAAATPTSPGAGVTAVQQTALSAPTAPATAVEAAASEAPVTILPTGSAQDQYAFSFGLLRKAEYDKAEQALGEFMAAHPDVPLAHNAHYWLGETFYVRAQYARAAEVFLDAFQKTPTGAKAPDILLKLGMSLANLDKKREACASFSKLMRDYPRASSAIKRKAERQIQQNACQ